jgi:predicted flap endonuclease-1-like 5' DNA nuclease
MASLADIPGMGAAQERAQKALSFPVGAASPLWFAFGAAASAGLAFWWMTRWTRAANLEAAFAAAEAPVLDAATTVEIIAETIEAEVEETLEALAAAPAAEIIEPDAVAEPEPEAVIEAVAEEPAPEPAAPDDLTVLVGIGPKLGEALAARGVTRFAQIAAWTAKDLAEVDAALNLKGRAVRDAWVAQAARLSST